ncbi:MAG: acyl-[acyl-carrier-protein]-phospholipid O-acyltransferase [Verrucomicrobiales bacterium]|jgi:acyl-[acyl-carrier-protein]-phospholipid O-acyltransferase/long-chain-fatty-acid--[acyl-carrier-protein] ligase
MTDPEAPATPLPDATAEGEIDVTANDTPSRREWRSLWLVMGVQTLNALNDKVAQLILLGLAAVYFLDFHVPDLPDATLSDPAKAVGVVTSEMLKRIEQADSSEKSFAHVISLMLSLPFVLFAPVAGWFSDKFSKRTVILLCLYAQLAILGAIAFSLWSGWFKLATTGFFVLAVQSTFFSPAKVGIVKELVGTKKLAMASGIAQMLTILAIILGGWLGGFAFKEFTQSGFTKWQAAAYPIVIMCGIAFFAILAGWNIKRVAPAKDPGPLRPSLLVQHFFHLGDLLKERRLRLTALGIGYFWFAGSLLFLITIQVAGEVVEFKTAKAEVNGFMMAHAGLGIALGSVLVAMMSPNRIELGMVPVGGLGMALTALVAAALPPSDAFLSWFNGNLFLLGAFSAMFLVPLNALLQDMVPPNSRGRMLSASALLDSAAGLVAIGVQFAFIKLNVSTSLQFALMGVMSLAAALYVVRLLPQNFIRFIVLMLLRMIYKIRPINAGVLPQKGGAMLVANHLSYIDAFILSAASDRMIRFVIFDHYMTVKWMVPFLKLFGVVPISADRAKEAVRTVADAVKAGDLVCIFPEGQLTRTGVMNEIKKGFQLMVRQADAPVIPVYMDDLWGSIFSFERGCFFKKWPYHFPFHLSVHFGDRLPPKEATSNRVREALMDLSVDAMSARKELTVPVEIVLLHQLRRRPWRRAITEYARSPRPLKRSAVFASAVELAKKWRRTLPSDQSHIGVVLPNSSTSALVNLGLRMAGRVPVNLPLEKQFSAAEMGKIMTAAGIQTVISTPKLKELLTDHYWPETVLDMNQELRFSTSALWLTRMRLWLTPKWMDWKLLHIDRSKHDPESAAVGWLCDDANGRPMLTQVSHRSLLANIERMNSINAYRDGDILFSEPHFASAAGTVLSLWYPLMCGMPAVMISAAADVSKWRAAVAAESISWIVAGPIARAYLLTGAALPDPSPLRLLQIFDPIDPDTIEKLGSASGVQVCRCLASDALGGLIGISIPDPNTETVTAQHQPGALPGAVGRLLPGTTARVVSEPPTGGEDWKSITARASDLTLPGHIVFQSPALKIGTPISFPGSFDLDGFILPSEDKPAP